jgi:hypothetical protein
VYDFNHNETICHLFCDLSLLELLKIICIALVKKNTALVVLHLVVVVALAGLKKGRRRKEKRC